MPAGPTLRRRWRVACGHKGRGYAALLVLLPTLASAADVAERCEAAGARATVACMRRVAARVADCYRDRGAACAADDAGVGRALAAMERAVRRWCPDADGGLVARLRETCLGEPASLAARSFGGPHAARWAVADAGERACLAAAFDGGARLIAQSGGLYAGCLRAAHRGGTCHVDRVAARAERLAAQAAARIGEACPALADAVGLTPPAFVARAAAQARCLTATAHRDTAPLALDCGPRPSVVVPPRGAWTRVVLDEAQWGTRCGDGGPYAFWLRLAPAGAPLDRAVISLQPGGVCVGPGDCGSQPPAALSALDDAAPAAPYGGYLSDDPAINPLHDWTMLYLPYCTQDLHIGGGTTSVFSASLRVHRFGALNARAGLRYLRDVLWTALADGDAPGWRPDRLRVLFGGESAGGHGVRLNYHYVLDDLRWANATAVQDAGLGLDTGLLAALGSLIVGESSPYGWGIRPYLPPYCQASNCVVGTPLQAATSARLLGAPAQRILMISNQVDGVQNGFAAFPDLGGFVNAVRQLACAHRDLPGLEFFLPALPESLHVLLRFDDRLTLTAGGTRLDDWLAAAAEDPAGVVDRIDEGTLVADIPGVLPLACE